MDERSLPGRSCFDVAKGQKNYSSVLITRCPLHQLDIEHLPNFLPQEHKKAFEAFLNALKLDPANAEIEKVM